MDYHLHLPTKYENAAYLFCAIVDMYLWHLFYLGALIIIRLSIIYLIYNDFSHNFKKDYLKAEQPPFDKPNDQPLTNNHSINLNQLSSKTYLH